MNDRDISDQALSNTTGLMTPDSVQATTPTATAQRIENTFSRGRSRTLYRLDPPVPDLDGRLHEFVIVSQTTTRYGDETGLFPATRTGKITSWREIAYVAGELDDALVLERAGYTCATPADRADSTVPGNTAPERSRR